ncbi:FixH family protein [Paenibacillus sp. y28]|uniref:FixH family protein n=1 Tax=Paenibacillus sp. y28 TaxID=3129110 RepID=UPI003015E922
MKRSLIALVLCGVLAVLPACASTPQDEDPSNVKVELVTEPAAVKSSQETKIGAKVTGMVKEQGTTVQFDIRKSDFSGLPDLVTAESEGKGEYSIKKTFDSPGSYIVYIHVYRGELHITKKKLIEVS